MKIIAVNIANPVVVRWKGKGVKTGIYKKPVSSSIVLEEEDVRNDTVVDRKYHGGRDKACYLFSADHYPYWKSLYPDLNWDWGMFGENITVQGLNEPDLYIGDILKMGNAVVQVSQPRQPCFKLGIRFNDQGILKDFIAHARPGAYLRVLTPGTVTAGDPVEILERDPRKLSIQKVFELLYRPLDTGSLEQAMAHPLLAESCKRDLGRLLTRMI